MGSTVIYVHQNPQKPETFSDRQKPLSSVDSGGHCSDAPEDSVDSGGQGKRSSYGIADSGGHHDGILTDDNPQHKRIRRALFRIARKFKSQGITDPSPAAINAATSRIDCLKSCGFGPSELRLVVLEGIEKALHGAGEGKLAELLARADAKPIPEAAMQFPEVGLRRLVGLCIELQIESNGKPFFLAREPVAQLFGISGRTMSRWLRLLCRRKVGILELVNKGKPGCASEYRLATFTP